MTISDSFIDLSFGFTHKTRNLSNQDAQDGCKRLKKINRYILTSAIRHRIFQASTYKLFFTPTARVPLLTALGCPAPGPSFPYLLGPGPTTAPSVVALTQTVNIWILVLRHRWSEHGSEPATGPRTLEHQRFFSTQLHSEKIDKGIFPPWEKEAEKGNKERDSESWRHSVRSGVANMIGFLHYL